MKPLPDCLNSRCARTSIRIETGRFTNPHLLSNTFWPVKTSTKKKNMPKPAAYNPYFVPIPRVVTAFSWTAFSIGLRGFGLFSQNNRYDDTNKHPDQQALAKIGYCQHPAMSRRQQRKITFKHVFADGLDIFRCKGVQIGGHFGDIIRYEILLDRGKHKQAEGADNAGHEDHHITADHPLIKVQRAVIESFTKFAEGKKDKHSEQYDSEVEKGSDHQRMMPGIIR